MSNNVYGNNLCKGFRGKAAYGLLQSGQIKNRQKLYSVRGFELDYRLRIGYDITDGLQQSICYTLCLHVQELYKTNNGCFGGHRIKESTKL